MTMQAGFEVWCDVQTHCDGGGFYAEYGNWSGAPTRREAREDLKRYGWKRRKGPEGTMIDVCSACLEGEANAS